MRKKSTDPAGTLFGLPVLQPEWLSRRNDARQRELEKTQALRAARLAAQAREPARKAAPIKSPAIARVERRAVRSAAE